MHTTRNYLKCCAVLFGVLALPSPASAEPCITDEELEATIGDQVRSGAFAINAAALGDRHMCSSLPIATAIQRYVARSSSPQQGPDLPREGASETSAAPPQAKDGEYAAASPDLEGFLEFSSPANCAIGPRFATFLSDLVDYPESDERDIPRLGKVTVPEAYETLVGAPREERSSDGLTVRVRISGRWHGIPVVALEGHYWNGGDPGGFSILMRSSLSDARTALNRAGFNIPSSGKRTIPGDYETSLHLEQEGSLVSFSCL